MFMKRLLASWLATILIPGAVAAQDGVIARCGASEGQGYFFHDPVMYPNGPEWADDGISNGKLLLVRLGEEWDIQFGDTIGEYGYRQDGATVFPVGQTEDILTIGAFRGTYVDMYTFNFSNNEVLWTSHKIGTAIAKVGIYRAECSQMSPILD